MTTTLSLITCVYNREKYLSRTIASVLNQTYQQFDYLIWDDGSTDQSLNIARRYAQKDARIRVVAGAHLGVSGALQAATSHTQGNYLGWVDSDDQLAPTALAETAAVLDAEPEVGLVYTDHLVMNAAGEILGYGTRCRIPYSKDRLLIDFMTFHFRLIRRSAFDCAGGIDTSFEVAPDYDLCLRLSEVTQVKHLQRPLYFYRQHSENISQQQRLKQIHFAQVAIARALERRGLADRYEIEVQIESRFVLKKRRQPTQ